MIPLSLQLWKGELYYESLISSSCLLTSILYHSGETLNARLFEMNPGQWHRLDTLFSILMFQSMFFYVVCLKNWHRRDQLQWMSLVVALVCQEANPWNVLFTIFPICFPIVIVGIYSVYFQFTATTQKEVLFVAEEPYNKKALIAACSLGLLSFCFFYLGLDEDRDWLRINHSLWHLLIGLASFFLVKSKAKRKEKKF